MTAPAVTSALGDTARAAPEARAARPEPDGALRVVRELATGLDRAGIRYCQFKSNQHLAQGVRGITDLDVLVDRAATLPLAGVLAESGYKRFSAPPGGDYPGVEDYLAMDAPTGSLVHLHLHYQLTTGERHLKGYRFPWEELVLSRRHRDRDAGFYACDPDVELLFLLVRNAVKIRWADRLAAWTGRDRVRAGLAVEFDWLRERVRVARVVELARTLLGAAAGRALEEAIVRGPSLGRLLALRRCAQPTLALYRTYLPASATLRRWRRELQSLHSAIGRRFHHDLGPISRTNPRGGTLIALIGPDGSGKSSLTRGLAAWLRWKLDARVVYFGSGDGPSSLARRPLKAALEAARTLGLWRTGGRPPAASPGDGRSGVARAAPERFARAVWALVLALEKRRTLKRAWRARNRGMIVLCDRYPQSQVVGFNDGPLLEHWTASRIGLLRALGRWEGAPYRWAEAQPPELVIKLHVSPRVADRRKPGMHPAEIQRRVAALAGLRYPAGTRVADLDADQPLESVLLQCKQEVWGTL